MDFPSLLVKLISGVAGGVIVGCAFPELALGIPRNSISGVIGGVLGGQCLQYLGAGNSDATDMQIFLCSVVGGSVGGAVVVLIFGTIKHLLCRKL